MELGIQNLTTKFQVPTLLGVVSTEPGVLLGGFGYKQYINHKQVPVALVGRVPVKVSLEGGEIKAGDRITLSSVAGVGMKAHTSGQTIGVALEEFDGSECQNSNDKCQINNENSNDKIGKILVFVNLGYSKLDDAITNLQPTSYDLPANAWSVDQTSGKVSVNFFGDLKLNGNSILDVSSIIGMWGKWSIDENGKVVAKEVEVETLKVKEAAAFGTPEKRIGITLYDPDGQPYCVMVERGGALKSEAGACGAVTGNLLLNDNDAVTGNLLLDNNDTATGNLLLDANDPNTNVQNTIIESDESAAPAGSTTLTSSGQAGSPQEATENVNQTQTASGADTNNESPQNIPNETVTSETSEANADQVSTEPQATDAGITTATSSTNY